jgi:outer membrane protein assembly factor BamB
VAGLTAATIVLSASVAAVSSAGYFREADLRSESDRLRSRAEKGERDARNLLEQLAAANGNLEEVQESLDQGKMNLYWTYLRLARSAMAAKDPVQANAYLMQCPPELRRQGWYDLKHVCYPDYREFEGGNCVAFSPDGKWFATARGNVVLLYDWASGRQVNEFSYAPIVRAPSCMAFSPDSTWLAVGAETSVIVWDLKSPSTKALLRGHTSLVREVAFMADGRIASASGSPPSPNTTSGTGKWNRWVGEIIIWDLAGNTPKYTLSGYGNLALSADGRRLATYAYEPSESSAGWSFYTYIYDLEASFEQPAVRLRRDEDFPVPLAFLGHTDRLLVGVETWNIAGAVVEEQFAKERYIRVTVSPVGHRLATSTNDPHGRRAYVTVWNLKNRERERILPVDTPSVPSHVLPPLPSIAFSPDGRWLATATDEGVKVWDVTPSPDATDVALQDIAILDVGPHDWPQWGGSRHRNNAPLGEKIPATWEIGEIDNETGRWSGEKSRNIKWVTRLGSQSYGNPVVANGKIYVGTNNMAGYLKRYPKEIDLGVFLCLDEDTGKFLWQHSNEKLPTGRAHDWPLQGVCSTPVVEGDRVWYVSNRGEVVCLDAEGFYDGQDDGLQEGAWQEVFTTPLQIHDALPSTKLPAQLLAKFAEMGIKLSINAHAARAGASKWTLREWRQGGYKHLYDVHIEDGNLRVFKCKDDGSSGDLFFTMPDRLIPDIVPGPLPDRIRQEFLAKGFQLPHDARVEASQEGQLWILEAGADEFRLSARAGFLHARRSLKDSLTQDADVIWRYDMMRELGISQHNMTNCSMTTADGRLFVCTSNGIDVEHKYIPAPDAPSFIALDRDAGELIWTDNSPGENILHCQYASPCYGVFGGQPQIIFPGGDGWLYSFDPAGDGDGNSKLLWKFDCNPKDSFYSVSEKSTRNPIIGFPVVYDGLVYVAVGDDPEHYQGPGHLWCIDPDRRGDISPELVVDAQGDRVGRRRLQAVDFARGETIVFNPNSGVVWHYTGGDWNGNGVIDDFVEEMHRSLGSPAIKDDILYIADFSGLFHCLNAKTGRPYWTFDMLSETWSSPLIVDDKVYIADMDGDVSVFRHSSDPRRAMKALKEPSPGELLLDALAPLNADASGNVTNIGASIASTPIVANNVLYISTQRNLFAIANTEHEETP